MGIEINREKNSTPSTKRLQSSLLFCIISYSMTEKEDLAILPPYLQPSVFLTYSLLALSASKCLKLGIEFTDRNKDSNTKVHTLGRNRGNINAMIPTPTGALPASGEKYVNQSVIFEKPTKFKDSLHHKNIFLFIFLLRKEKDGRGRQKKKSSCLDEPLKLLRLSCGRQ